ncbi:hypothetical protein T492DRAFT_1100585 [Pavlovales sp. CCMP2436]|nr:hypothetical protein T492DRAFT_1100585 [Pavlovales sp. CCMP2436]|mmetsp:Transcript_15482/g.39302  ORF Transcript_15482/g.39302 Transcript_15482/m.39302 type:complete len:236 (-) Transcript_15482:49-756(-)
MAAMRASHSLDASDVDGEEYVLCTAAGKPPSSRRVDHAAHRYPACIVWAPIHPITWIAPYIGHVGVCSSEGVVYDWVGAINENDMAFGWPVRYVHFDLAELGCTANDWDERLFESVQLFNSSEGPMYDFCTWNCHSFIVKFLNDVGGRGMCAKRWNLLSICGLFFFWGRFTTFCGVLQAFGPLLTGYALAQSLGGWSGVLGFFRVTCYVNVALVGWFTFASALGMGGMHGRVPRR